MRLFFSILKLLIVGVFSFAIAAENYAGIGVALYKSSRGATVAAIAKGSPASAADLRLGDCVIAVNGADIAKKTVSEVKHMIRDDAGKPLTLTIVREGNTFDVDLTRVKMEIVSLGNDKDVKNVASRNFELLDIVDVKVFEPGQFTVKILTADGSLVSQKDISAESVGLKSIQWDNTLLAAGSYTIVLKQGNRASSYPQKLK